MFKNKEKFALWVYPETLTAVEEIYRKDNCRSKSELIEKAILFYIGYLRSSDKSVFLPNVIVSTIRFQNGN